LAFPAPEPIRSRDGLLGFSMDGCDLLVRSGYPLLPVKILKYEFELGTEVKRVSVRVGGLRELPIDFEVVPAPAPAPTSPGLVAKPGETIKDGWASAFPSAWYDCEVHYGIDPDDLRRKVFLTIRLFPARLDGIGRRLLWAEEVDVEIEVEEGPCDWVKPVQDGASLLVVTSEELLPVALELASYKNATGIPTVVRTVEWISANYGGRDLQEKIRNCVREAVEELGIIFVLVLGDHDVVPARLAYIPDGYKDGDPSVDGTLVETDLYYADVLPPDVSWNDDGDEHWGEMPDENIDGYPDVLIGRFPASSASEAEVLLAKLQAYYRGKALGGDWLDRVLLMGVDLFDEYAGAEGEILKDEMALYAPPGAEMIKLYESLGNLYPSAVQDAFEEGCVMANFAGHGFSTSWWLGEAGGYFTISHVNGLSNRVKLPVVFTMSCLTSRFSDCDGIGERFVLKPGGGSIAYFGATRAAWAHPGVFIKHGLAGKLDLLFSEAFFSNKLYLGQVWADAIERYIDQFRIDTMDNGYYLDWKVVAEYSAPFGDPSLRLLGGPAVHELEVTCLDADGEEPMPNVEVRASMLGVVMAEGTTSPDGSALLTGLPSGSYLVEAFYAGLKVGEAVVDVPGTESLTLICSFYDLVVKCTDQAGEPLPGASVNLRGPNGLNFSAQTGLDGSLRFEDLPNATYALKVYWDRPAPSQVFMDLVWLDSDEKYVEARCEDVVDASFLVVDAWGRPVEGATIKLYAGGELVEVLRTGPDGRAEVEDILAGDYEVIASAELAPPARKFISITTHGQVVEIGIERWLSPLELCVLAAVVVATVVLLAIVALVRRRREVRELRALFSARQRGFYRNPGPASHRSSPALSPGPGGGIGRAPAPSLQRPLGHLPASHRAC
ncbi:MAG TPA: hypothetical protein ENF34_04890, partial [Candidatus Bathyarchaeota archaeon]|nr:hypothetical protein [Candidatus Bathyarchaeota archaeon]